VENAELQDKLDKAQNELRRAQVAGSTLLFVLFSFNIFTSLAPSEKLFPNFHKDEAT
jgi:hypothetical protein